MPDDRQWSDALCDWFYRPELAGQPAYLFCDPSVPSMIAEANGWALPDPLADLLSAVRSRVAASEPLGPWLRQAHRWRREGRVGNPPWVAVLAVTVLAASGGGRDDGLLIHERAYYKPLRRLFGLPQGAQPPDFDNDVRMLWTFLREWLDDDLGGSRGLSTASAPKHLCNVGWALSQTVLTPAERSRLPEFFRLIGALPGEDIAPAVLLASYQRWASRRGGLGASPPELDRSSAIREVLAAVLHQSLLAWDGRPRDERGRVTLPLLLGYYSARGEMRLASRAVPGLGHRRLAIGDQEITLGAPDEQIVVPGDPASALEGQPIRGMLAASEQDPAAGAREIEMRLPSTDLHVLASSAELAMWVEVGAASFDHEHVVIVRERVAREAERAMAALGGSATPLTRIRLPAGWYAYHRFEPTRLANVDPKLGGLVPSRAELAQLSGGLPIELRNRIWLTAGPPDVALPDLVERQESQVLRLDGNELPWPADSRLRLREHGLRAGLHELIVAGRTMRFTLVDEAVDQSGHGDLELTVDRRAMGHRFPGRSRMSDDGNRLGDRSTAAVPVEVTLCGAELTTADGGKDVAPLPRHWHLRIGGLYFVLGGPGQAARLQPSAPSWLMDTEPRLYPRDADLDTALSGLPFSPRWLLHVPPRQPPTVLDIAGVSPAPSQAPGRPTLETGPSVWQLALKHLDSVAAPGLRAQSAWRAWIHEAAALCGTQPPPGVMVGRCQ
ncbi:hypothetical protein SAMN06893096_103497 [Geodermatophilus pulveris]|uniref:Uncharacterized protein n=1 Tax=Geodermatophilus pulveris TaxID=1564159 RepID=A0A239E2E5_9ACTN|nr:hypothetical protein [Geodermatophilus pulveris]SNS38915.1 hypothetical protein SAMN06893096_103497 [Geodermatophilus pulveris]